jgi:hypothetical protein
VYNAGAVIPRINAIEQRIVHDGRAKVSIRKRGANSVLYRLFKIAARYMRVLSDFRKYHYHPGILAYGGAFGRRYLLVLNYLIQREFRVRGRLFTSRAHKCLAHVFRNIEFRLQYQPTRQTGDIRGVYIAHIISPYISADSAERLPTFTDIPDFRYVHILFYRI